MCGISSEMPHTVYILKDPRTNQFRYVGQTRQTIFQRLGTHCSLAKSGRMDTGCMDWIRELLAAGFKPVILTYATCDTKSEADLREQETITCGREAGWSLLNQSRGGAGPTGVKRSEKTRKRMGDAKRGIPKTAEHRLKLARALGGRPFVDDLGNRYESLTEAERATGIMKQNIWHNLKGKRPSAGGRCFVYC